MPLSAKGRIELYLPDLPDPAYQNLLRALEDEFTYNFGGCTIVYDLDGSYLSKGEALKDRIILIYTDSPYTFQKNKAILATYCAKLKEAAHEALDEESILVAVWQVYHSV